MKRIRNWACAVGLAGLASSASCMTSDTGAAMEAIVAWLDKLEDAADVAEITCWAEVEAPSGSGVFKKRETSVRVTAGEMRHVVQAMGTSATSWQGVLEAAKTSAGLLLKWTEKVANSVAELYPGTHPNAIVFKEWFPEKQCRTRGLRTPPTTVPLCPLSGECPENPDTPGEDEPVDQPGPETPEPGDTGGEDT